MKVIIGNNGLANSLDGPVMLQLSKDEIEKIRALPEGHDIVVFHPNDWPQVSAQRWSDAKLGLLRSKDSFMSMNSTRDTVPTETPAELTKPLTDVKEDNVVSDDELLNILNIEELDDGKAVVEVGAKIISGDREEQGENDG